MSPTERRDTRLPVTEEVGSEGGSYADATNQVMTFSGPANPNASPADAIGGRMPFESEARGQFSGTSIGTEDDTASGMIRYPTEAPSPADARAGRRTAGYPWRSALIGAAAGAVAVIGLSRLRQRWCC